MEGPYPHRPAGTRFVRVRAPIVRARGPSNVTSASAAWQDVGVITQRPDSDRRRRAAAALQRLRPVLADEAERALARAESVGFLARLDLWFPDVHVPLSALYGDALRRRWSSGLVRLALRPRRTGRRSCATSTGAARSTRAGTSTRGWSATSPTPTASRARFEALPERLDHLAELGVSYLHLMPLLRPRPGENDGGYAVMDYRAVDPRVGTMDDLEVAGPRAARARDEPLRRPRAQPHRPRAPVGPRPGWPATPSTPTSTSPSPTAAMPDAYEATISDVFPDQAPGSFTWVGTRTAARRLGVDDVLRLPVGPQLRQPERLRRGPRHGAVAGQPRHRDLPHGRRAVHVEAAGHLVHEPARGARPHAGPARAGQARRAGDGLQGGGDRLARATSCPTSAATPATGRSASWPTTTSSW